MNLIQAADLLKNLSDQQLVQANQNPTVIPPYLVLAEMKRREQVRAEFAKAQASQAQNKSVAQQTAENLMQPQQMQQGQPQQQPPQGQPQQPQGIMQAAPPQVAAMAGGGYVARYAEGTPIQQYREGVGKATQGLQQLGSTPIRMADTSALGIDPGQIREQFRGKPFEDYLSQIRQMQGQTDYGSYENLVRQQMEQAKARRPRLGDALIAAGAAMASNRDNRVGLASLLAKGIEVGSQAYDTAKREQQKELNTAMMAQVALDKMKQDESQKIGAAALQLSQFDQGKLIEAYKIGQQNARTLIEERNKAFTEERKRNIDLVLEQTRIQLKTVEAALNYQMNIQKLVSEERQASIRSGGRDQSKNAFTALNNQQQVILKEQETILKQMSELPAASKEREVLVNRYRSLQNISDNLMNVAVPAVLQKFNAPATEATYVRSGSGIQVVNPSSSKALGGSPVK